MFQCSKCRSEATCHYWFSVWCFLAVSYLHLKRRRINYIEYLPTKSGPYFRSIMIDHEIFSARAKLAIKTSHTNLTATHFSKSITNSRKDYAVNISGIDFGSFQRQINPTWTRKFCETIQKYGAQTLSRNIS